MHLTPGGQGPPGALFHWCAATDSGIRVVDVWQTREQYDAFAGTRSAWQVGLPGRRRHVPRRPQLLHGWWVLTSYGDPRR